jgi:hypothetical protein
MEDLIIALQNIADSMETVAESCKQLRKIADRLEQIETKLNSKIVVQVDLDKYCDGKSINGQVNVSNWM